MLFLKNRLELNFAVNVAAPYTLTELVMPLLEKAAPDARVITVASGGMYTEPLTNNLQVYLFHYFLR
jgi:dehydrogenase/reductase SDR family protein 12